MAYAEHWLTFFNDLLRNDYSGTGFITGGRQQVSGWLYEALVTNKPFDQFARELIAQIAMALPARAILMAFAGTAKSVRGKPLRSSLLKVCRRFFGINMKCASCHDSFIDRWKLEEAYGLAAIYSTPGGFIVVTNPSENRPSPNGCFPELGQVDA